MIKLVCELKQQTPMIHFQSKEPGACLRATEVKPKLDRFIRENEKNIPDGWFIELRESERKKKGCYALNYKMRFRARGNCDEGCRRGRINRSYFGNQGENSQKKEQVLYKEGIELTILCFIPGLMIALQKYLEAFFVLHNFGTRQNKGFGSFVVSRMGDTDIKYNEKNYIDVVKPYLPYGICYHYQEKERIESNCGNVVLEDIRVISGLMKSGFNLTKIDGKRFKKDYFKGYIFRYFMDRCPEYINDKKYIKENLLFKNVLTGAAEKISDDPGEKEGVFCRAVLGLSPTYLYSKGKYTGEVKVENEAEEEKQKISRFPSPILWTVAGRYLLGIPDEKSISEILNKRFCFTDSYGNRCYIATPEFFNMHDFIVSFVRDFNDKETPKGGAIGLRNAENSAFSRVKSIELNIFEGEEANGYVLRDYDWSCF